MQNKQRPSTKNPFRALKRLFGYMWSGYKIQLIIVIICILLSAFANVQGSLFIQTVIDGYITPMVTGEVKGFSGLLNAIIKMAAIYGVGVITTLIFNRMMVKVSQGTQKKIRDDMFTHIDRKSVV